MEVITENLGKKYNRDWIFRKLNLHLSPGNKYAVTGPNGSGKSTLLSTIAGIIQPSEGSVTFLAPKTKIPSEYHYLKLVITAPYQELIEEFSLKELLEYHLNFRSPGLSIEQIADFMQLSHALNKKLTFYSSGMKQRVKLGLALIDKCPLVLLDEPTVNLDSTGIQWYRDAISKADNKKIFMIFSNQSHEYDFCNETIDLKNYK